MTAAASAGGTRSAAASSGGTGSWTMLLTRAVMVGASKGRRPASIS